MILSNKFSIYHSVSICTSPIADEASLGGAALFLCWRLRHKLVWRNRSYFVFLVWGIPTDSFDLMFVRCWLAYFASTGVKNECRTFLRGACRSLLMVLLLTTTSRMSYISALPYHLSHNPISNWSWFRSNFKQRFTVTHYCIFDDLCRMSGRLCWNKGRAAHRVYNDET